MTMKAMSIVLSVLLFTFTALASVDAGPRHDRHGGRCKGGHGWGGGPLHVLNKLDLTQEQKQAVAGILKAHREKIGEAVAGMSEARAALREAVLADESSEDTVRPAAQNVAAQQEQVAVLVAQIVSEVKSILTPEQKERLLALKEKRGQRMKGFIDSKLSKLDDWIAEHGE